MIFDPAVVKRSTIKWWQRPFLWFVRERVSQDNGGNILRFKVWRGRVYILGLEGLWRLA